MEDDIQNYLSTVMFRGTPCTFNKKSKENDASIGQITLIKSDG